MFNPHADIAIGANKESRWFVDSVTEEIAVTPGTQGNIVIHNPYYWFYHEIKTTPGFFYGTHTTHTHSFGGPVEASVTATVSVDKDGKVVIGPPLKNGTVGLPGKLDGLLEFVKQDGQDEGHINISTVLKSTKATSIGGSTGKETSGSVDVKPEGVGVSTGSKDSATQTWGETTAGTGVWTSTYGVVFKVKKKPPTPPTAVTAKIAYDKEGRFLSGDDGIKGVQKWWGSIPPPVRRLIMRGKKEVFIHGNASDTSTPTVNEVVVKNRLKDVRKKLISLSGEMIIHEENLGSTADDRSVVVEVRYSADEATGITP